MVPIQRKENHVSISSFHNEKIPSERTPRTYRRKRASLINSCHRRTKQTFFSKQLLVFLVTITLFRGSGDQCTSSRISGDSSYCCNSGTASIMLVSAASVAAAPATVDEDKKKRGKIKGVHAHPGGSVTPAGQRMQTIVNGGGGSAKKREAFIAPDHKAKQQANFSEILKKAGKSGIGGGVPGAIAGVVQVLTLMWLRTIMNYQCRYGSTFSQAFKILYNDGGIPRFYRGLSFALFQAPLARFVATAANDGVESLLANLNYTKDWGPGRSTIIASMVVGVWRMMLMPIDTCKTVLQVDSVEGFRNLMRKVKVGKIYVLYQGAVANAVSAIFAHYPWFYTYKALSNSKFLQKLVGSNLLRNASIGFASSIVSDTLTNSIRVIKTTKQAIAVKHTVSYGEVVAMILAADGWKGLFGRGLRTRILGNAVQSVMFTVIWRGLAEKWGNKNAEEGAEIKGAFDGDEDR